MPFNLRGGRPKNMGQGIYWVQRHVADQRAAMRAQAAADRRTEEVRIKLRARLERCQRLYLNVQTFFEVHGEITVDARSKRRIETAQARWEELRASIFADLNSLTVGDLNKFATAGRSLITVYAEAAGIGVEWTPASIQLQVGGAAFDFS